MVTVCQHILAGRGADAVVCHVLTEAIDRPRIGLDGSLAGVYEGRELLNKALIKRVSLEACVRLVQFVHWVPPVLRVCLS